MDSCRVGSSLAGGPGGEQTDCEPAHHAIRSWQDCVPGNVGTMTAPLSQRRTICSPPFSCGFDLFPPTSSSRFPLLLCDLSTRMRFQGRLCSQICLEQENALFSMFCWATSNFASQHKCGGLVCINIALQICCFASLTQLLYDICYRLLLKLMLHVSEPPSQPINLIC